MLVSTLICLCVLGGAEPGPVSLEKLPIALRIRPGITCRFLGVPRVRYSDPVTQDTASDTGSEYRTRGTRNPCHLLKLGKLIPAYS